MKIRKLYAEEAIYISIIILSLGFKFYEFPYFLKYGLAIVWSLIYCARESRGRIDGTYLRYMAPMFVFYFYTILLIGVCSLGVQKTGLLLRATSQLIQKIVVVLFSLVGVKRFGKKVLALLFSGIVINNVIGVFYAIAKFGLGQFFLFILTPLDPYWNTWVRGGRVNNAMELHETTFALGFFLILILCFKDIRFYQSRKKTMILTLFLLYLGFKRIQILALVIALLIFYVFLKHADGRHSAFTVNLVSLGVLFGAFLYVFMISSDVLVALADRYDINFMSRLEWYAVIRDYFTFSPLYLGNGWGSLSVLITQENILLVHSDILRMFFDAGFWGFIIWILYYFKYFPDYFLYKDLNAGKLYLVFMAYTVVTYVTDNTLNYFVFQTVLLTVPTVVLLYSTEKTPVWRIDHEKSKNDR